MSDLKTWLDAINTNDFSPLVRDMLIHEAQRTHFVGSLPDEFTFLQGACVDLGFEKLGLTDQQLREVRLAFVGAGVAVPGTTYRLRNTRGLLSVVEPVDGSEQVTLPVHWRQGVLVLGQDVRYTWIGKLVRRDQLGNIDLRDYEDAGDGWVLKSDQPTPPPSPSD